MKFRGYTELSKQEALKALDWMPRERDKGFMAGRMVGGAVNRTYTRVDGDRFQISRTAGMGSAVCSGRVSEANGVAVIDLLVTFGLVSAGFWLLLAMGLFFGATAYYVYGDLYMAVVALGLSVTSLIWYWFARWDARYLMSAVSERLGGVEWTRVSS